MCRRADESADNRANCRRDKGNPSGIAAVMVGVMNDMIPRRRGRRAMRSMPPAMMRRGNRRASRQRQPREKNRNRFDGLVHITPSLSFSLFCGDCEAMSEGPTPSPAYRELGNRR